jgi:hypothetical protein
MSRKEKNSLMISICIEGKKKTEMLTFTCFMLKDLSKRFLLEDAVSLKSKKMS